MESDIALEKAIQHKRSRGPGGGRNIRQAASPIPNGRQSPSRGLERRAFLGLAAALIVEAAVAMLTWPQRLTNVPKIGVVPELADGGGAERMHVEPAHQISRPEGTVVTDNVATD